MHAMPEWFAIHESWCSDYNNTNDPIAGVYLLYKGKTVENHGIARLKNSETYTVDCVTDSLQSNIGTWFYPNGTAVSSSSSAPLLYQVRDTSAVYLSRKDGGPIYYGIYRCDIPDKHEFIYSLYVGLYDDNSGKVLLLVLLSWLIISSKPFYTV